MLLSKPFDCFEKYAIFYTILEIIGVIFILIFIPVYIIIFPIYLHYAIKDLYYFKFLPEIRKQYNNKLIFLSIVLGEEILSLVLLFPLIVLHYIFNSLYFPILCLVLLIRYLIYFK
jgi:hypothetical protein